MINMSNNFELERLKPKFDIFKIPENRVHELTDSNVSRALSPSNFQIIRSAAPGGSCLVNYATAQ